MRWWLALAFACIALLTALVVAKVFVTRSDASIRARIAEFAAGSAVSAATTLSREETTAGIRNAMRSFSSTRRMSVYVFDENGELVTPARSLGVDFRSLPNREALVGTALSGRRLVETIDDGKRVTIALPLRRPDARALVVVVARPDLEATLGIVHREIVSAAVWATAAGALAGLGVAVLITRRIRRIASAAREIESGRFDIAIEPRFRDEIGGLAETIDQMRGRLAASFAVLESDRDRLERLLERLHEGVVAVDAALRVEFANTRASALLGDDVQPGAPLPDALPQLRGFAIGLFDDGAAPAVLRVTTPDESSLTLTGLPASRQGASAVLVIVDTTEADRREEAERAFVTNAAHELRTPLTAIATAVGALQAGGTDEPDTRDRFLEVIERQTTRLGSLVDALLTLSRVETMTESTMLEPIRLTEFLDDLVEQLPETAGVHVRLEVRDDPTVWGHRGLLTQALTNLLSNAVSHGRGEALSVTAWAGRGGAVRLRVSDSGPGLRRVEVEKLFERFYRGKKPEAPGYGLGLAIVKSAVTAMNGEIEVWSEPGKGTSVTLVLDAIEAGVAA